MLTDIKALFMSSCTLKQIILTGREREKEKGKSESELNT